MPILKHGSGLDDWSSEMFLLVLGLLSLVATFTSYAQCLVSLVHSIILNLFTTKTNVLQHCDLALYCFFFFHLTYIQGKGIPM